MENSIVKSSKSFIYIQFWRKQDEDDENSEDEESELGVAIENSVKKQRSEKDYDIYKICEVSKELYMT